MEKGWYCQPLTAEYSEFNVFFQGKIQGSVKWTLIGQHNAHNALAAIAAARHAGVPTKVACEALENFQNVKRRLEIRGVINGITVYDDFAHHPTAIAATLSALRQRVGKQPITAVVELRSNSMRMGIYKQSLAEALLEADSVLLQQPADLSWSLEEATQSLSNLYIFAEVDEIIEYLVKNTSTGEHILIMSNGAFGNIHARLLKALSVSV
jgi:UDP-N-acetylmuramate: L-alanyl-gamma-D-glutamyl-meso-diaminopimelate ligase